MSPRTRALTRPFVLAAVFAAAIIGLGATPAQAAPMPPSLTDLTVINGDATSTISWTEGGRVTVRDVVVDWPDGTTQTFTPAAATLTLNNLINGEIIPFCVNLTHLSSTTTTVCDELAPGLPVVTDLVVTNGDGVADIAWSENDRSGAVTAREVSVDWLDGTTEVFTPSSAALHLRGLVNGEQTPFCVTISNAQTTSTAVCDVLAPHGAPAAPTLVTLTPGDGELVATFTVSANDGGHPLENVVASVASASVTSAESAPLASLSEQDGVYTMVLSALENGTAYRVTLSVSNEDGISPASATLVGKPVAAPAQPAEPAPAPAEAGDEEAAADDAVADQPQLADTGIDAPVWLSLVAAMFIAAGFVLRRRVRS